MTSLLLWFSVCLLIFSGCSPGRGSSVTGAWTILRSDANPLITPATDGIVEEWGYHNINGPSVIRVPEWVDSPLGTYYLYFAHHRGSFIRMAFADHPEGPWTLYDGGVLHLSDTPALDHIASPDVLVDDEERVIRMYYHSVDDTASWKQTTYLAESFDGLAFRSENQPKGPPYLRAFELGRAWWAIAKVRGGPGGMLLRADGPEGPFEEGPVFLEGMRHGAVLPVGERVEIVFSRIGDAPERLLRVTIDPQEMWNRPVEPQPIELLKPELEYEGGHLPVSNSQVGEEVKPVNALRDPFLFVDSDGETYLFYALAGEYGIGVARVDTQAGERR